MPTTGEGEKQRTVHRVQQGEHLSGIAGRYGFESFAPIWNHDDNAEVRKRRDNPHALRPGDELVIPDKMPKEFDAATDRAHTFRVRLADLRLRVKLLALDGTPVKDATCTLTIDGDEQEAPLADGLLDVPLPRTARTAIVVLADRTWELEIGHLDPIDEPSGQQARLRALGYYHGPVLEADDESEDEEIRIDDRLRLAWEMFQEDQGSQVTGEPTEDDVSALLDAYGS